MKEISLGELSRHIAKGELSLDQVTTILRESGEQYRRPDLGDAYEVIRWQDRIQSMNQELNELISSTAETTKSNPELARAHRELAIAAGKLIDVPAEQVLRGLGYCAGVARDFEASVDLLSRAARLEQDAPAARRFDTLRNLVHSLRGAGRYRDALRCTETWGHLAKQAGLVAQQSIASFESSLTLSEMGRRSEALNDISEAIRLREAVSDDQAAREGVTEIAGDLHHTLGKVARSGGQLETAIAAFQRAHEDRCARGDFIEAAKELSEIGFLYLTNREEDDRGQTYLKRAAEEARQHGAEELAEYWLAQLGTAPVPRSPEADYRDASATEAYALSARVASALRGRNAENVRESLEWLIAWAEWHQDRNLELVARSNLANLFDVNDDLFRAILKTRSAAKLAELTDDIPNWIIDQGNLSNRYLRYGEEGRNEAHRVLDQTFHRVDDLLQSTVSSEFRQTIQAGVQRLYEDRALLRLAEGRNRELVEVAERARARNLTGWIGADWLLSRPGLPAGQRQALHQQFVALRAVETESEETYFKGGESSSDLLALERTRQGILDSLKRTLGDPSEWRAVEEMLAGGNLNWDQVESALVGVQDSAVLYLFGLSEGIVTALLRLESGRLSIRTAFIRWQRDERLRVLSQRFAADSGAVWSRGNTLKLARHIGKRPIKQDADYLQQLRKVYFPGVASLFEGLWPQNLAVVPHRELQLIPHHELLSGIAPECSVVIAPSLQVLAYCLQRQVSSDGPSVLLADETGTLRYAQKEGEAVARARKDTGVARPASLDRLFQNMPDASLLHFAVHGVFTPENPYRSGLLAFERDQNAQPTLCVSDVLSRASLGDCRLVVLSACESGLARQHPADEYTGLPASFLLAGAKTVIATQWPVEDHVTFLLMQEFYARWQGGGGTEPSPARALQQARQEVIRMPRAKASELISPADVPPGEYPFNDPSRTAPFQVFGAW